MTNFISRIRNYINEKLCFIVHLPQSWKRYWSVYSQVLKVDLHPSPHQLALLEPSIAWKYIFLKILSWSWTRHILLNGCSFYPSCTSCTSFASFLSSQLFQLVFFPVLHVLSFLPVYNKAECPRKHEKCIER